MNLKNDRLWPFGRQAQVILSILVMVFFVGGSGFYATAQRGSAQSVNHQAFIGELDSPSGLNASSASNSTVVPATSNPFQGLYCASDDGRRNYCNVDTRYGVQLVRQRNGSPCIQGRTWGYDRRGIWVDRGCRADFTIGNQAYGGNRDYGYGRNRDYGYGRNREYDYGRDRVGGIQTFYCESGDGKRHWCSEGLTGTVRLVRQRSGSPCIQGQTWGRDRGGVWVDRGCRADFEVRR